MTEANESQENKQVEISFGTTFTFPNSMTKGRIDVITDLSNDGFSFTSTPIDYDRDGNLLLRSFGGTGVPSDIGSIVGHLTVEEVTDGLKRGWAERLGRKLGKKWSKEFEKLWGKSLLERISKSPRKITLE